MKLNTLGDLRNLLEQNDGIIKIGLFKITNENKRENDIDFNVGGQVALWIPKDAPDEELLSGIEVSKMIAVFRDAGKEDAQANKIMQLNETIANFEEVENGFKKQIEQLEVIIKQKSLTEGMVVAYEKILLGRGLTIGQ